MKLPKRYVPLGDGKWRAEWEDEDYVDTCTVTWPGERAYPGLGLGTGFHGWLYQWAVLALVKHGLRGDARVMDCACGSGAGSAFLTRHGFFVTAQDGAEESATFAKQAAGHLLRDVHCCALPRIPEVAGVFDAVVSIETLEHIEEDAETLREFRRVTKPGGLLVISTPNATTKSIHGLGKGEYHVREYTPRQLRELITANGWEVLDHDEAGVPGEPYSQCLIARRAE